MSKSIHCKRLPKEFNAGDKNVAIKQYFSDFGRIAQIIFQPGGSCTVEYETVEEARRALHESGFYKGKTFIVQSGNSVDTTNDRAVQEELDIMSGTGSKLPSRMPSKPAARPTLPLFSLNTTKKTPQANETMPPPPSSPVMIHKMTVPELQRLIATPAYTSEQKYRVLEARDKLTRIHLGQTTDITKAKSTKGVCPDMCPEKERLMREAKHQIASFETEANSRHIIDHRLAVKQYSRSSADQEMPLPRELRSEPVLRMTMMYLLHEIADLCDTSNVGVSDWFHFLWDRTRSIRKDIAQQELGCQGSVRLVEQCARFHIHCAGRLIAEEPQVFDQKINTENLTKCLQSLKYMYHDLRLKGEHCRNEPEFRAYIILLNLNDSNFLWEVKQLPLSIQQSAEVRFGIDVFKALEQNNYVRFFKLVRRTTYLNACILLRYFNQVRARALATIVKAYSIKSGVPISLSSLAYTLAFEDEQSATQFFEYYGLSCDTERVFVDRTTFYYPDLPFIMDRAINVVEQKRFISVGAVVAGGEEHLAARSIFANHVPENSFDSRGMLKTSGEVTNVSLSESEIIEDVEEEEEREEGEYVDENNDYDEDGEYMDNDNYDEMEPEGYEVEEEDEDEEDMDSEEDDQRSDVVDADLVFKKPSPVSSVFRGSMKSPSTPVRFSDTPFEFEVEKRLPDLPSSGFSFAELMAGATNGTSSFAKSPKIQAKSQQSARSGFSIEIPSTGGFTFSSAMGSPGIKSTKPKTPEGKVDKRLAEEQRLADIKLLAGPQSESLIKDVCSDLVRATAEEVIQEHLRMQKECDRCAESIISGVVREMIEEVYREECLEYHIGVYCRQKTLKRAFAGWRKRATINRVNRDRTQMTPLWMPMVRMEEQKVELESNHQQSTLIDLARYRLGQPNSLQLLVPKAEKLNIEKQISTGLTQKFSQHSQLLFNVVISVPGPEEGAFGWSTFLQKWMMEHLNVSEDALKPLIVKNLTVNAFQTVGICVRLLVGRDCLQEDGNCLQRSDENLDGIIFYMSEKDKTDPQENRGRLQRVMQQFHRKNGVPVVVFNLDTYQDEESIMIKLGMDDDRIGPVLVDPKTDKRQMKSLFKEAISFLVEHYSIPNENLRTIELINLVTSTLGETLWMRVAINSTVNAATNEILRRGNLVTEIYNEAVDRVIEMCCQDYSSCPDVPRELEQFIKSRGTVTNNYCHFPVDWRSPKRQKVVRQFLESLKLRTFPAVGIVNASFEPLELLDGYVNGIIGSAARNVLYQMVQCVRHENNWVKPMLILTRELFLVRLNQARANDDLPVVVLYDDAKFSQFQDTPWWLQTTILKRRFEIEPDPEGTRLKKRRLTPEPMDPFTVDGLDDILRRASECVERAEKITSNFKQNKDALSMISSKYDDRLSQLMMCQDNAFYKDY